jgi:hypothetical protein
LHLVLTRRDNIPVTRPRRTLEDLRTELDQADLRDALRRAEVLGLPLDGFTLVDDPADSELERLFLALCRRFRIPKPETQGADRPVPSRLLWRSARLVVETDGYRYHRGSVAFEQDRARDNELTRLGYEVLRLTYRRVTEEPAAVAALVRSRL